MIRKYFLLALFMGFAYHLQAQIGAVNRLNQAQQFKKTEWDIRLNANWKNPYLQEDIALDMLLTSPSGKKLVLPCYYEQGESGKASLWKARFAPQEQGTYSFTLRLMEAGKVTDNSKIAHFTASASASNGFLHPENNWIFKFDNGKPFRGIGENIAWESRASDDSKFFKELHQNSKYSYDYMLPALAKNGGNFFRTWICPWNLPLDWKRNFNNNRYTASDAYYNPSAIAKLDRLMEQTDSLKLYMMLTLGAGNYNPRDGGFSPTAADFFVNPQSKARYKNRLRYIVARWGYSTSIGAWEFFNEVDNVQFGNKDNPISADAIVKWHDEMSAYLKQIDPYQHIVTTSISHRDLRGLNSLPHIDINQKHIYKNTTGIPAAIIKYEHDFNKPYVIGEYSYEWDWSRNFDDFAPEMDSDFKRGLWYGLFSPTPVLPMSWWWEYFDSRGTDQYLSKIKTVNDQMLAAGKGVFREVKATADSSLKVLAVKCGKSTFIYVYNSGKTPLKPDVSITLGSAAQTKGKVYECETGTYRQMVVKQRSNTVQLSAAELAPDHDLIYIIK